MKTPELLLPAGSPEAFHAAIKGGADAVYLGLSRFNARGRAKNFNLRELAGLLEIARNKNIRVYITLNTLIRNNELEEILDTLHLISKSSAAAVIIQDWGIYFLIRKFFPSIEMHASTQMGIHNSAGATQLKQLGFTRIVLARELTITEIAAIKRTGIELELFVHGALCYSLSGHCLFSSWQGGMSANRGLCRQPCRRLYFTEESENYIFSLNDLQLISRLPNLKQIGVDSLKIEGRMRNAEYVYTAARAYRMVLDDPSKLNEALKLLQNDLGRKKSGYFASQSVPGTLNNFPFTGLLLGKIKKALSDGFTIIPMHTITSRSRLRILPQDGRDSPQLKVARLLINETRVDVAEAGSEVTVITGKKEGTPGDSVYLTLAGKQKFSSRIPLGKFNFNLKLPSHKKAGILQNIQKAIKNSPAETTLFLRIDQTGWMRKLFFSRFDFLLLKLTLEEMEQLDLSHPFIRKNLQSIIIQLPLFIPESKLKSWRSMCIKAADDGISRFALAQPAQLNLMPVNHALKLLSTEDAYILNDAAALALRDQGFSESILPLENDLKNLEDSVNRSAIVPLFSFPPLFRSRVPLGKKIKTIKDWNSSFNTSIRNGITVLTPEQPAAILQHRTRLEKLGYKKFLLDFSYMKPSQNTFNRILSSFEAGKQEQQARLFNFKNGLQ